MAGFFVLQIACGCGTVVLTASPKDERDDR